MASQKKQNNKNLVITTNQLLKELLKTAKVSYTFELTEEQFEFIDKARKGPLVVSWEKLSEAFEQLGWSRISDTTLNKTYKKMKKQKEN